MWKMKREFWCAQADMKTESIDKRMCPDKIALCFVLCEVFVLSTESKTLAVFNDTKSLNKTLLELDGQSKKFSCAELDSAPPTIFGGMEVSSTHSGKLVLDADEWTAVSSRLLYLQC